jgi:hypothetical protein
MAPIWRQSDNPQLAEGWVRSITLLVCFAACLVFWLALAELTVPTLIHFGGSSLSHARHLLPHPGILHHFLPHLP